MNIRNTPIYAESWNVAYRFLPSASILNDKKEKFNIIPNSIRYWAADPMVFEHDGTTYIFAELYDYTRCRGIIGVSVFDGKKFGKWKPIIVEDTHISYPFIFEHKSKIYMLPENSASNKLTFYESVNFPFDWKPVKTLIDDMKVVDTTLVKNKNGFYGFTQKLGEIRKDLKFELDENLNVIKLAECEVKKPEIYRNGGNIFELNDKYIRVCQDCAEDYGAGLYFRTLNKETFIEEKFERVGPQELLYNKSIYLNGMHTYTATNNIEVIDIKTRRFNLLNLLFRIINKLH